MYAVIKSGGKQHRVSVDEKLNVELIKGEDRKNIDVGQTVTFDDVLMVVNDGDIKIGEPVVKGAKVTAEVVEIGRGDKVRIVKHKRRKHYHKEQGHRQWYTRIKITDISA